MQAKQKKTKWLVAFESQVSGMDKEHLLYSKAVYVCKHAAELLEIYASDVQKEEELSQSELYNEYFKRTQMYLKHFFVSFAMMVERGEIPETCYKYYGVESDILQHLDNITDVELEMYCKNVFVGEDERIRNTETERVFNPSSVQLQAQYDMFHSYFEMLQILREHCRKSKFAVDAISAEIKDISLKISQ